MKNETFSVFEDLVRQNARALSYPPTPDIASSIASKLGSEIRKPANKYQKRLAYALAILLVLLGIGFAVPPVRAQILEFLQIGAVRIFLIQPASTSPAPSGTGIPAQATSLPSFALTPVPTSLPGLEVPASSTLNLYGQTTLELARENFPYPIKLPSYPTGIGNPDEVYLQDTGGDSLILVWLDPENESHVNLSLQMISGSSNISIEKLQPRVVQETEVNGQPAVWAVGPYMLRTRSGDYDSVRLINGQVLIWKEDEITYRLETGLPLGEAIHIAESLQ